MLNDPGRTEFDHAVIMVRDRLEALAPQYEGQGFRLSDKAVHNLGSCNQLIVLDDSYIELLGWPPGAPPARKEIADSPLGLEALVFRSDDAHATYERLVEAGFSVNPVQELTRTAHVGGRELPARFHTVRFADQPIAGLRMYFCRHLTPECVWAPEFMDHPNGACSLVRIDVHAADAQMVAWRLALVADAEVQAADEGWDVVLANLRIHVADDDSVAAPVIRALTLAYRDGSQRVLATPI
ncbi:VOC family protein [Bordetella genomosp. 12]|uniref:Glyoxalase-like domain-containing protein n=1 Tax=Bordetella genomosp. 12 TaxID=463035 RepID=A0A261VU37_9BORD|nr:VOC family protein [Bordetella genomosp. 12]OZI77618.1 hypothetical protein CAL22_03540 [Bordetella genomosp. 12]